MKEYDGSWSGGVIRFTDGLGNPRELRPSVGSQYVSGLDQAKVTVVRKGNYWYAEHNNWSGRFRDDGTPVS